MGQAVVGLYAIGLIGVCSALPIQSVSTGDRNVVLLGALMFLSFGAVIAGCVCCRRRKKGFEEFRNESGTPEANKTEYPIFRALSPEAQRHSPVAAPPISNSNENLIEEEFDNNNGPISPADLENIENNNAVDYIQNQNEVGITIEQSPFSINRNLINTVPPNADFSESSTSSQTSIPLTNLQDVAVTTTSSCLQYEQHPAHSTSDDLRLESFIINKIEDVQISTALEPKAVFEEPCVKVTQSSILEAYPKAVTQERKVEVQIHAIDSANTEIEVEVNENKTGTLDTEFLCKETIVAEEEPDIVRAAIDEKNIDCSYFISDPATPEEVLSIKSSSSGKSSEVNSVEEALRALDCAIAGENSLHSGEDDEGDLTDEDFECNNTNFQNVIRQLLITDSVKRILPELTDDQINDNLSKLNCLDGVRTEAEMLVDSILSESRRIVEEKEKCINNQTIVVQHCEVETELKSLEELKPLEKEDLDAKLPEMCIDSPPILTPCESVEDFLSFKPLDSTSTPCVQKFMNSNAPTLRFAMADDHREQNPRRKQLISPEDGQKCEDVGLSTTFPVKEDVENPNPAEGTFTFPNADAKAYDKTFNMDKTFDVNQAEGEDPNTEYTHPGDPCTSKQALERDSCYPAIVLDPDQDQEMNSEDMTTVTPVNTPIELNYSNEIWNAMTKGAELHEFNENAGAVINDDNGFAGGGWFLHPQASNVHENETFEVDAEEEEEADLESTFDLLRKQLAEVLPQPQGITGPAEYSDDEDDIPQNRTFDEYRSPLDASVVSLFEGDPTPGTTVQNEMFINYKKVLSPILEVSEEETCKTFVLNETKCLDSTSTGCVETGEAIMGVSKALMASNDTLFNFEDTLGEREEVFSPRTPSRSDPQLNNSNKSGKSTEENSVATLDSEKVDSNNSGKDTEGNDVELQRRRSPPRTIDIPTSSEMMMDSDVCSPEQQKTFSEGTNSSNTDRVSSDVSATVDHDTTFTTYTNDEKTCITVVIKDDERISEISEPEWGSTTSYGGYEMNSLTDVPSLDYIVTNDDKCDVLEDSSNSSEVISKSSNLNTNLTLPMVVEMNASIEDNQQEDSGNSTHMSTDDRTTNSDQSLEDETQKCDHSMSRTIVIVDNDNLMNQSQASPSNNLTLHNLNLDDREKCRSFIQNEIAISSSQSLRYDQPTTTNSEQTFDVDDLEEDNDEESRSMEADGDFDFDSSKENKNPNVKGQQMQLVQPQLTLSANAMDFDKPISPLSYQKVQTNSQDAVIVDKKAKLNATTNLTFDSLSYKNGGVHENIFYKPETTILPNKHQQTIINYSVSDITMNGENNEQHCLMVADEIIAHLSGEEDPWAEPMHNDISYTGPCTEIITSFTNEWDSDVDDSHSSEEFMYVRGTPTKEKISEIISCQGVTMNHKSSNDHDFFEYEGLNEADVWSTHEDKVPVADSAEDEISEGSSSEFEGEFVPSCWDSMATPARSALKSPDKSSSQPNKKRRSVAFKKQRYHSVYEYPRENVSLSPSYSEPYLYSRDRGSLYYDRDSKEEFSDGFTVSSSMRPFHGSQFNALCHTWPTDSDFSWSQIEDLGDLADEKKLASYTNSTSGRWPQNFDSIDLTDGDVKTENLEFYGNNRPDSGVGESAEMLSDRLPLGELCHTKSTLRLPLELLPPVDSLPDIKPEATKLEESLVDRLILPTPSCTGSMDSISSSSGSERQVSFSTFGKNNNSTSLNIEINEISKKRPNCNTITITRDEQLKPALILIENGPIDFPLGSDKIKQSDSTDEDSGIESIMKVNKECD